MEMNVASLREEAAVAASLDRLWLTLGEMRVDGKYVDRRLYTTLHVKIWEASEPPNAL